MAENKITIVYNECLQENEYILDKEYEDNLYSGHVSELNIVFFINKGWLDPTNGLPLVTKDTKWWPRMEKTTRLWGYSTRR